MWFLVFIVIWFSLLWSIFFSRKLCFLWSPCLFLIAVSISLDTSGVLTVWFFLKTTSPFWIILSISLDELNSIDWLLKSSWWIFLKQFLFYCCKRILIWQKIFFLVFCIILFYLLFIYLLIFCWILLWMLTSLMISNLNITESTALKITGPWNIYVYGLLSHEMLLEKFVKPPASPPSPPPIYLMYAP